jgi:hypothetical protein
VSKSWLVYLGVALLFVARAAPSAAQTGSEPEGYRQAIDGALEEMQLSNFVEAREQFARAHALFPNARTFRGLGISEFELKHYTIATDYLRQALASKVRELEGRLRKDTEALLARASSYVGELSISVTPNDATLLIDGTRRSRGSHDVHLDVGDHVLEFRAEGYATERREVTVRGGQLQAIELQLNALGVADSPPQPLTGTSQQERRADSTPLYKRWWLWTIVGLVVAGAAAGTAIALTAKDKSTEYYGVRSADTPSGAGLSPLWKY